MTSLDPKQPEIKMVISASHARMRLDQVKARVPELAKRLLALAEDDRLTEALLEENLPRGNEITWGGIQAQKLNFDTISENCELIAREALSVVTALDAIEHQLNLVQEAAEAVDQIDFSQEEDREA